MAQLSLFRRFEIMHIVYECTCNNLEIIQRKMMQYQGSLHTWCTAHLDIIILTLVFRFIELFLQQSKVKYGCT